MKSCDPKGPLMLHIIKLYNSTDVESFGVFGRVLSGTITQGQQIRILGENYSPEDEEDMSLKTVQSISIYQSRYFVIYFLIF
jgi:U5 small nuclear ribonucleoprotein component